MSGMVIMPFWKNTLCEEDQKHIHPKVDPSNQILHHHLPPPPRNLENQQQTLVCGVQGLNSSCNPISDPSFPSCSSPSKLLRVIGASHVCPSLGQTHLPEGSLLLCSLAYPTYPSPRSLPWASHDKSSSTGLPITPWQLPPTPEHGTACQRWALLCLPALQRVRAKCYSLPSMQALAQHTLVHVR